MSLLDCTIACSICGISGIHACPGFVLPPVSPEVEARLTESLERIFGKRDRRSERDARFPNVYRTTPQGQEQAASEGSVETSESGSGLT